MFGFVDDIWGKKNLPTVKVICQESILSACKNGHMDMMRHLIDKKYVNVDLIRQDPGTMVGLSRGNKRMRNYLRWGMQI